MAWCIRHTLVMVLEVRLEVLPPPCCAAVQLVVQPSLLVKERPTADHVILYWTSYLAALLEVGPPHQDE